MTRGFAAEMSDSRTAILALRERIEVIRADAAGSIPDEISNDPSQPSIVQTASAIWIVLVFVFIIGGILILRDNPDPK